MEQFEDTKKREDSDTTEEQHLILDGTANLDYAEDEQIPRVKGLLELIREYFGSKPASPGR